MYQENQKSVVRRYFDAKLSPQRQLTTTLMPPSKGWLYAIRKVLGLTQTQLAHRTKLARSSIAETEQREVKGTITLETLRRLANAMDCDVVYYLAPRTSLTDMVRKRAYAYARHTISLVAHSMSLEAQKVAPKECEAQIRALAEALINNSSSRIWNEP